MATIDLSTFLIRGKKYTFTFMPSFFSMLDFDSFTSLTAKLQAVSGLSAVDVHAGENKAFSNSVDVTFTYVGDGADVVAVIAGNIMQAWSGMFGDYDFAGAGTGEVGVPEKGGADIPLPGTGTLALIVVGLVLVVFLASGGAGLIRRATS